MFRLPVCPHCGTVYRYKEVKSAIRQKDNACYHCQKRFKASVFPTILVGALIPLVVCIALNIYLLTRMENLELLPLFAVTLCFLLMIYLIVPFFTRFKKTENKDKTDRRSSIDGHQRKRRNRIG